MRFRNCRVANCPVILLRSLVDMERGALGSDTGWSVGIGAINTAVPVQYSQHDDLTEDFGAGVQPESLSPQGGDVHILLSLAKHGRDTNAFGIPHAMILKVQGTGKYRRRSEIN